MNVVEVLITGTVVAVATTAVARYVWRSLRTQGPDCGACEGCPGHSPQGNCAAHREDGQ